MGTTRKVAVMMDLSWPYKRHYEVFAGIRDYAQKHGRWELHIGDFPQFDIQQGKKFDGIIGRITSESYAAANEEKIPVVNVWFSSPVLLKVPSVLPDMYLTGRLAAEHLITRGLRRLVHFGFKSSIGCKLHYEGMRDMAKEKGCVCKRHLVAINFSEQENLWKRFLDYFNKIMPTWQAPIGIGFSSDELAHAICIICTSQGWSIPDQMTVISTSNEPNICNSSNPTLSSIDLGDHNRGYEAARLLDELMESKKGKKSKKGKNLEPDRYVPPKELVLRRSSDAYALEDEAMIKALAFMAGNSHRKISISDIAKAAGIGRQSLEHRFRRQLKRSVNEELIRLRISKMKRLLVESVQTIGEVSHQAGFGTTANMHVMFKRHTGMTPITYREKHNPKLA